MKCEYVKDRDELKDALARAIEESDDRIIGSAPEFRP
jgi:hypothetical protein